MKATRYYHRRVLHKRPYLRDEHVLQVLRSPLRREVQPDGRIRHWGAVEAYGGRILRVVTFEDGETVHNAFLDRGFRTDPRPEGAER